MNWNKKIYIASKLPLSYDDFGNQIVEYGTPKEYEFNVQPISADVDLLEFGEKANMIQKAVIKMKYKGMFKENDVAYLDDVTPCGETVNGEKANYRLYPPRNQNTRIIIYFERLTGK